MAQAAGPRRRGPSRASWRPPSNALAMGNRTARNTGILGTGVEAIGDEEKMSDSVHVEETAETDILRLTAQRDEARATLERIQNFYRETLNEMAERLSDEVVNVNLLVEENAKAEARGYRRGVEDAIAAGNANAPIGWPSARRLLMSLLEQTSDSNRPHPENGTGAKSET
jgi:hypothetical protein